MDYDDLEKTYHDLVFGYDEPDAMFMNGANLKEFGKREGKLITHDSDGNEILDGEVYCLTDKGIFLYRQ
jgi:hypothetical protein